MDIAVNLVESYLRLTGYLTLSEFDVQARRADGSFEAITDIDVMAVRFPGDVYVGDPHEGPTPVSSSCPIPSSGSKTIRST